MKEKIKKPRNIYSRMRVRFKTKGPSKTKQEQAEGCDINNIMKQYSRTGELNHLANNPRYGDFITSKDYQEALDNVIQAQEDFNMLPASTRDYFNNEPAHLIEFLSDDKNLEKAQELGLIRKPVQNADLNVKNNLEQAQNGDSANKNADLSKSKEQKANISKTQD